VKAHQKIAPSHRQLRDNISWEAISEKLTTRSNKDCCLKWFVERNGKSWKELATDIGKSEIHLKDTWRRMKPKNLKKGAKTQDEYQNLFDLVNLDLRVKAHQKIAPSHRQVCDSLSLSIICF